MHYIKNINCFKEVPCFELLLNVMMKHDVIIAQESDLEDENMVDYLLNASIHEQEILTNSSSCDHDSTLRSSPFSPFYDDKLPKHRRRLNSRTTTISVEEQPVSKVSSSQEYLKKQDSFQTATGVEVELTRKDSFYSTITFNEPEHEKCDFNREPCSVSEHSSPPLSPRCSNGRETTVLQSSDSSQEADDSLVVHNIKRRSSLRSSQNQKPIRRRSISFNETVDRVTYDDKSWNTQTSELLEGGLDITPSTIKSSKASSTGFPALSAIEDDAPKQSKTVKARVRNLFRRKQKK